MRAKFVNIEEGVGDKYLYNHYGIEDEDDVHNNRFNQYKLKNSIDSPIGSFLDEMEENTDVYKNPKNLGLLQGWVRGCSDKHGNFYVANSQNILHGELIYFLGKHGLSDDFVDWQRYEDSNTFYLAEGYDLSMEGLDIALSDEEKEKINSYTPNVMMKNPKIKFINNKTILEI